MVRLSEGLDLLADAFVRVRVTAMDGVDLEAFQFDYDMTWACVFLEPDGTVLGRYGSRDSGVTGSEDLISPAGLRAAMALALELHRGYPANRGALAGKQPRPVGYARVEDIDVGRRPGMGSCYHCHHVAEALARARVVGGAGLDERGAWPYPTAERLGLTLDPVVGLRVAAVAEGSAAAAAGVAVDDVLIALDGQPLVSHADVQWVLHHAPAAGALALEVRRGAGGALDEEADVVTLRVVLREGWRRTDPWWRESRWGIRPGFELFRLDGDGRRRAGAPADGMALKVTRVFGNGVRANGVLRGDVLIELDGITLDWDEADALLHLRGVRRPGDVVPVVALRRGERRSLEVLLD